MAADEIRSDLPGRPDNSTVRTFLRILESKGHVVHDRRGRRFVFRAVTSRDQALRTAVAVLEDRFFDGSRQGLTDWLIDDGDAGTAQKADDRSAAGRQPPVAAEPVNPPTSIEEGETWLL